jgi:hypothetical protein
MIFLIEHVTFVWNSPKNSNLNSRVLKMHSNENRKELGNKKKKTLGLVLGRICPGPTPHRAAVLTKPRVPPGSQNMMRSRLDTVKPTQHVSQTVSALVSSVGSWRVGPTCRRLPQQSSAISPRMARRWTRNNTIHDLPRMSLNRCFPDVIFLWPRII